jgi:hypothetical protein
MCHLCLSLNHRQAGSLRLTSLTIIQNVRIMHYLLHRSTLDALYIAFMPKISEGDDLLFGPVDKQCPMT